MSVAAVSQRLPVHALESLGSVFGSGRWIGLLRRWPRPGYWPQVRPASYGSPRPGPRASELGSGPCPATKPTAMFGRRSTSGGMLMPPTMT